MNGGQALASGASWSLEGLAGGCTRVMVLGVLLRTVGPLVSVEVGALAEAAATGGARVGPLSRVRPAVGA